MKKDEIEKIVKRDLPGYKVASKTDTDTQPARAQPDEAGPDIDALKKKYLGKDAPAADDAGEEGVEQENTDDALVAVQPDNPADPYDHGARPKTVVVSGKEGRIVGSQG